MNITQDSSQQFVHSFVDRMSKLSMISINFTASHKTDVFRSGRISQLSYVRSCNNWCLIAYNSFSFLNGRTSGCCIVHRIKCDRLGRFLHLSVCLSHLILNMAIKNAVHVDEIAQTKRQKCSFVHMANLTSRFICISIFTESHLRLAACTIFDARAAYCALFT